MAPPGPPPHLLATCIATLKKPPSERHQEQIHLLSVLMVDHLRAFSSSWSYSTVCAACRALSYQMVGPRVALSDADDSGQLVLRILISGSVRAQRRCGGKSWLTTGFLRAGDMIGLPAMLENSLSDEYKYSSVLGEGGVSSAEFATLRRFDFERCLHRPYVKDIGENAALLARVPGFSGLTESALRQLVACSRQIKLPAGAVLIREGEESDELFVSCAPPPPAGRPARHPHATHRRRP